MNVQQELERFYDLADELARRTGGPYLLGACTGREGWPQRGVYLVFEPGEYRADGHTPRVVRVGTHALKRGSQRRLWQRLRQHRGNNDGGGNHRGSVFRKHVGAALLARDGPLPEVDQ